MSNYSSSNWYSKKSSDRCSPIPRTFVSSFTGSMSDSSVLSNGESLQTPSRLFHSFGSTGSAVVAAAAVAVFLCMQGRVLTRDYGLFWKSASEMSRRISSELCVLSSASSLLSNGGRL